MGFVTGPRRNACPEKCTEFERFRYAALAIAYHETAIIVTFATPLVGNVWIKQFRWISHFCIAVADAAVDQTQHLLRRA